MLCLSEATHNYITSCKAAECFEIFHLSPWWKPEFCSSFCEQKLSVPLSAVSTFSSGLSKCSEHNSNAQTQICRVTTPMNDWRLKIDPDPRKKKSQIAVRNPVWNKFLWFHYSTLLLPINSQCCPQQQVVSELAESTISVWLLALSAVCSLNPTDQK